MENTDYIIDCEADNMRAPQICIAIYVADSKIINKGYFNLKQKERTI